MSFTGQFNFGYPITSQNIVKDVPDNAVIPLSIGSSLQGNILGVTFGDLKSQISIIPEWGTIIGNINDQNDLMVLINGKQPLLFSGSNIKTINGNSILGSGNLTVGISDGDKGDVTVSNSGNTWTVDSLPQSRITNLVSDLAAKQATLTSGSNIKTINGSSILGSGDLTVGLPSFIEYNTTDKTVWSNGKGDVLTNTTYGDNALRSNTSGTNNTGIGYEALRENTTGFKNIAVGSGALLANTTGNNNIGIGLQALYNTTTATGNTAVGNEALRVTNGNNNTGVGYLTLRSNTTGVQNTAVGSNSMYTNTTGQNNVAIGPNSLFANTTGESNIAIGNQSMQTNTTGVQNTAVGSTSLSNNQTGFANTAIGNQALFSNTTGTRNTAIGNYAIGNNTTGSFNIAVGGFTQTGDFSGSVILGYLATATADNQFVVGSSGTPAGAIATETITPNRTWTVRINGANYKIPLLAI